MRAIASTANLTRSRGIALIAGLLLMVSMVLLSLAVATGVLLERRASGNLKDSQLALHRAQLAGKWGEYWLFSRAENPLEPTCESDCDSTPLFPQGILPATPEFEDAQWWTINAQIAGLEPETGSVRMDYSLPHTEDAHWLIEELHIEPIEPEDHPVPDSDSPPPKLGYYRIFGHGSGRLPGSVAVTEAIVARPWIDALAPSPFPPGADDVWFCEPVAADIDCGRLSWRRRR